MAFAKYGPERAMFADLYFLCEKYWDMDESWSDDQHDMMWHDVQVFVRNHDNEKNHIAKRFVGDLVTMIRDRENGKDVLCEIAKDNVIDTILRRLK